MGQVYNGERTRGLWFALGTLLIVPWLIGIVDAWRVARAIARGERPPPDAHGRGAAFVFQLAVDASLIFGVLGGVLLWQRLTDAGTPPDAAVEKPPAAAAAVAGSEPPAAPSAAPAGERPGLEDGLTVPELMRKGRMACGRGQYAECEDIMRAVLDRDPGHREAWNLMVEASTRRRDRDRREPVK